MIQSIIDRPWIFLGIVFVIVLLQFAAVLRIRRDRRLKRRALVDRRQSIRPGAERRWQARPRHK